MSNVWDRTTEFLSDNLGSVVPVAILTIFVPLSVQASLADVGAGLSPSDPAQITLQLVALAMTLVMSFGGLALAGLAMDAVIGAGPALALAVRRFPLALLTMLVSLAVLLILLAPFAALFGASGLQMVGGQLSMAGTPDPLLVLGLSLYAFVLLLALIWIGARLVLAGSVVVAERRALTAFGRSWRLTRGITWKVIGVLLLFVAVQWVATMATKTVVGSVLRLLTSDGGGTLSTATVVTAVLTGTVSTAFVVLGYSFVAKLYLAAGGPQTAASGAA